MKCKICGAKLRKEGDICKACYDEYCKEDALQKDTTEILKLGRKYLPKYQLTRYGDWYIVWLLIFSALMSQHESLLAFGLIIFGLILLFISMYISKKIAVNTKCIFYEKKIVYKYKDKEKTIAYSDLKNVTYYQNFFQKNFKLGDIQFHPDSGSYILGGFEIKNVPDIENTWSKIQEILENKRED